MFSSSFKFQHHKYEIWAEVAQTRKKIRTFGINLPQRVYPLKRFLKIKSTVGRQSQVRSVTPNFTIVAL